jgi:mRNA interferase RelE/StbE
VIKYNIKFKSSAAKEFKSLPIEIKQRIRMIIDQLCDNPRPFGVIKLQGDDELYRVRIGDYRIIYAIDDNDKLIHITRIGHRKDVDRD